MHQVPIGTTFGVFAIAVPVVCNPWTGRNIVPIVPVPGIQQLVDFISVSGYLPAGMFPGSGSTPDNAVILNLCAFTLISFLEL